MASDAEDDDVPNSSDPPPPVDAEFSKVTLKFGSSQDWEWAEKLPVAKDKIDFRRRTKLFSSWDINSNERLSLNEVEVALRALMGDFASTAKPVSLLGFTHARDENRDRKGRSDRDPTMIERDEFRMLYDRARAHKQAAQEPAAISVRPSLLCGSTRGWQGRAMVPSLLHMRPLRCCRLAPTSLPPARRLIYLRKYFALYHAFVSIDSLGEQDGRITYAEFNKGLGLLKKWKVVIPKKKAKLAFSKLDTNGGQCAHMLPCAPCPSRLWHARCI